MLYAAGEVHPGRCPGRWGPGDRTEPTADEFDDEELVFKKVDDSTYIIEGRTALIDFYKILGFKVVWISNDYLVMRKDRSVLNFYNGSENVYNHRYFKAFSKNTKRGYAVEIVLLVEDVKAFYKEIKDKVKVVEKLKLKPWGAWDFRIEDIFGFYVRITNRHDWINDNIQIAKTKEIAKKRRLKI